MAFAPVVLSGSTDGRPIAVVATASPGTTIHTAQASASLLDEIELKASNVDSVDRLLTLEVGGTTAADKQQFTVPAGETIALGTYYLRNSLLLKAFGAAASVINIAGIVNRQS